MPPLVFFGSISERRERILRDISAFTKVEVVPPGTYGDSLARKIASASAVINIHREDGAYAEVPRLLSAYRAGKVLISEPLAEPFIAGKHYIPYDDPEGSDPREVFGNLSRLAKEYRFSDLLRTVF
ncbi:MAG: hypothetical protein KDE03_02430 [Rhodobacteraceae bacterium]|nr:hypothetical protein [Paracoccaceae bacterium]